MGLFITLTALALFVIETCWASAPVRAIEARQVPVVEFFFEGPFISVDQGYGNFTITVPEDGSYFPISNTMVVYSIIPSDEDSDCSFVGADGTVIRINGYQQDILPQPLISVTCVARSGPVVTPTGFPNFTSFFPNLQTVATNSSVASTTVYSATKSGSTAAITSSAAGTGPSTIPPYPIGTGSSRTASIPSASASAPPGTTKATGGQSTSTTVPFTGNAARAAKSLLTSLLAFVGLIAVL